MRLTIASLRRPVKGDLAIQYVLGVTDSSPTQQLYEHIAQRLVPFRLFIPGNERVSTRRSYGC